MSRIDYSTARLSDRQLIEITLRQRHRLLTAMAKHRAKFRFLSLVEPDSFVDWERQREHEEVMLVTALTCANVPFLPWFGVEYLNGTPSREQLRGMLGVWKWTEELF